MADELSEEEVFANDVDPLDAIREIRKEEGVAEEDLPVDTGDTPIQEVAEAVAENEEEELDNLEEEIPDVDETDKVSDPEKDPASEGTDEDTDKSADKDEDDTVAEAPKRKFTASGQEYEFTDAEMLEQFEVIFGQAIDYTQKTQKIAPFRKMISALESEDITAEQLNVAIDALKGNKQAIKSLLETNNLSPFDVGDETEGEKDSYNPTDYGKNDTQLGIEEVTSRISSDKEYPITVSVIDEQWDGESREALSSNPSMIQGLHNDIKSGLFDKVAPVAMKMKVLDGNTKSDIEYYMLAGEQVVSEQQNSEKTEQTVADMNKGAQGADKKYDQASSEAQRKRSASPTRKRADRKGVIDYLDDDNDEDFDAWYKNLEASN